MELECEPLKENLDILNYKMKTLKNNKTLCSICQLDERETTNDKNICWERYKLSCGHIYHTRCFRRHCFYKNNIECPYRCQLKKNNFKYQ